MFVLGVLTTAALAMAGGEDLDLYDWMGVAPIVVHVEVQRDAGGAVEAAVLRTIRGDVLPNSLITVRLRHANRERAADDKPLRPRAGDSLLLLLRPASARRRAQPPEFELVRGIRGAREVPEGGDVLVSAACTLATIQDRKDERLTWEAMGDLMLDPNPFLVATALDHHLKFRRGTLELLVAVRPLLDHPQPGVRERAARLIGDILARHRGHAPPDGSVLHAELAARARRDPAGVVRAAATEALGQLSEDGTEPLLREIAARDPDQHVRYTAERLLYERRSRPRPSEPGR
jgi:hypothetical protein